MASEIYDAQPGLILKPSLGRMQSVLREISRIYIKSRTFKKLLFGNENCSIDIVAKWISGIKIIQPKQLKQN